MSVHPVEIGRRNTLRTLEGSPQGLYLDGGELGPILLPRRYVGQGCAPGFDVDVFVYRDSEDRLVATTETPLAMAGECAVFEVVSSDRQTGAFLNWGLAKDLLLPMREQAHRVRTGDRVVAAVILDERSGRIIASTRLHRHLHKTPPPFREGQRVSLLIADETDLGYTAVVDHTHLGLIYFSDLGSPLDYGQQLHGYIRAMRPDGKIDLALDTAGPGRIAPLAHRILQSLREAGGFLPFSDDSSPDAIRREFGASKKAFKQALGALYRERQVRFADGGTHLVARSEQPKPRAGEPR